MEFNFAADLVHVFDGLLPAAAVGADGRTPLHHAAAFARSAALARRLLAFEPAWAKRADAGGKLPIELLPIKIKASDEVAMVLREACGVQRAIDTSMWRLLLDDAANPRATMPSADAVRAAAEADPDAAARPFAAPGGWAPTEGALVKLRPGLDEMKGLRAGEVAAVTYENLGGDGFVVKRLRDGKPEGDEMFGIPAADLVHG